MFLTLEIYLGKWWFTEVHYVDGKAWNIKCITGQCV